jgi:hypothetical protein
MSMFSRALLIAALLVASTLARSDGIYNPTVGRFGSDGINNFATASAVATCSGTGLNFTIACNSQYIPLF